MTLDQIRSYINYICVKENSGGTLTPEQVNVIFPAASIDMFNKKVEKAQIFAIQNKVSLSEALGSIIELRDFIKSEDQTLGVPGTLTLSDLTSIYGYFSSMTTIYNGITRKIDLMTDSDWSIRKSNSLALPIDEYPMCRLDGFKIDILPNNISQINFTFYRIPATPIYDYYIDANANEIYLVVGASHTLGSGEIGSAGQTSGLVTSTTVELDWDSLYHVAFCNEVLSRVGINLKDGMVEQYINQAKQEQG
jgi:hypothetical protein